MQSPRKGGECEVPVPFFNRLLAEEVSMLRNLVIAWTVLAALSAAVRSQDQGPKAGSVVGSGVVEMMGGPRLKLLTNKPVQEELALTPDQKGKLSKLYREVSDFAKADAAATDPEMLEKLSKEERMARLKKAMAEEDAERAETHKKIEDILLPKTTGTPRSDPAASEISDSAICTCRSRGDQAIGNNQRTEGEDRSSQ